MSYRNLGTQFLLMTLVVLGTAATSRSQTLVGNWVAEDLANGTTFTLGGSTWNSRVGAWGATAEAGPVPFNAPRVDAGLTIGTNNRKAVTFNQPDTSGGGLVVDAGEQSTMRNPLVGLTSWTATVVFQTDDPAGGGSGISSAGNWFEAAGLVGIELGGGERGDWSIFMTDGNATNGAKLGAARGDPDDGVLYTGQSVNDGNPHVVTATFELNSGTLDHDINLFLDGALVGTSHRFSGGLNDAIENFPLRIGSHNNFGFFKGQIGEVQLHDGPLSTPDVQSLFATLDTYYGITGGPPTGNADFDGDGDVDGNDFLKWQRGSGLIGQVNNSNGDANGDGTVNGTDLGIWQGQYGGAPPLVAAATAVPEPASIVFILSASFGLVVSRRFRNSV